ncbi:MAG: Fe(2+)-trafficking protein [Phycisphaerae bacterium]
MAVRMVPCAKLGRELPGIDETTPEGATALRYVLLIGGPELRRRVHERISADAWKMWIDHQVMVLNEYRLDPMSDRSNAILREHLESFLFGQEREIPNYVPPPK